MGMRYWHYNDTSNDKHQIETLDSNNPIFKTAYQTTQIGNRTLRWLKTAVDESLMDGSNGGRPFFAYIGPHAPHFPAQPAPWYEHAYDDVDAPITPNYNVESPGKAQHVRQNPPLDKEAKCWENQHFRDRWSSLLSVDDIISDVVHYLEKRQVMDKTYIIYSSDHGYKQGQWRIGTSKQHPYETDIRVPFIIRGPGITAGENFTKQISGNVDVMPTMLHLAAGENFVKAINMDGKSMTSFLINDLNNSNSKNVPEWRDYWLNEYLSVGTYWNDHSTIWEDGNITTKQCNGDPKRGPNNPSPFNITCNESNGVGDGKCWYVDSTHSNSWRQLRIMNSSMNWNYLEYDPDWKFISNDPTGSGLQHYELYDIANDKYQMNNIYSKVDDSIKMKLHSQLTNYFNCRGKSCP
jgi:N-acetylglucosamine-6-sulfatase